MCRHHNHPWRGLFTRAIGSNRDGWRTAAGILLLSLVFLGVLAEVAGAIEVPLPKKEHMVYGDFPVVGRRVAVWVIAQLHLMFGAFVVGVPLFILIIEILGAATKNQRYDDLAHEFTRLLSVAFSTTATFGGILVFFLIGLYPTLMNFLARIFFPSMVVYVFLFFGEGFSMYLYYYGWGALKGTSRRFGTVLGTAILTMLVAYPFVLLLSNMLRGLFGAAGSAAFPLSYGLTVLLFLGCLVHGLRPGRTTFLHNQKWMHICFGILLNYFGLILMMIANSWATFMTSPAGIDLDAGVFRGTTWDAMNNFTWMPVNLHRFIANIAFGGSIVAAYAAFRFLASPRNSPERAHYDWMGYIGNFIAIIGLIPLPFAGYWLGREIYGYDQQLGITMMGDFFLALHCAGGAHWRAFPGGQLLPLARYGAHTRLRALSGFYAVFAGDFDGVFPGLVDTPQSRGESGRGAQDGWCAPSLVGGFRRHVGEEHSREHYDSHDVLELPAVSTRQ